MVLPLEPVHPGRPRKPISLGIFIRDYLLEREAPQTDIHAAYKAELRSYYEAQRKRFTKLDSMTYSSFTRYFNYLKQLGFVEPTGVEEKSGMQDHYSPAPPRVYYHLTPAGHAAPDKRYENPLRELYPQFDAAYFREASQRYREERKAKKLPPREAF